MGYSYQVADPLEGIYYCVGCSIPYIEQPSLVYSILYTLYDYGMSIARGTNQDM